MNWPKISVVTPSFGHAQYLETCLESVLSQEYPNLEYIVIDGGSRDGSVEIIRKHERKLAFWVSEPDRGHADALNKGFAYATGDVLCWLNSDDLMMPGALRTVAEIFERFEDIEWIQGLNSFWNRHGMMTWTQRTTINVYDYLSWDYRWIQQESVYWRRRLWESAGGRIDESYRYMVDGELWSRFFLHSELYMVDIVLGGWRNTGANRGLLHLKECGHEMMRAIGALESRVTPAVLRRARAIRYLKWAKRSRWGRALGLGLAAAVLARLPPLRTTLREARYKRIFWDDDTAEWATDDLDYGF